MDYEEVFDHIGHFGWYQLLCGVIIGLGGAMLGMQVRISKFNFIFPHFDMTRQNQHTYVVTLF